MSTEIAQRRERPCLLRNGINFIAAHSRASVPACEDTGCETNNGPMRNANVK